ncbi:hypothetical protein FNF29_04130 [Cafeteria roenbergensis]|uniref:CW-type domain-containing protein n=1 Tax=Cafeteria roenbergensis TaxID=33653 RepID=A0A5A8DSN1_CAFRO|nr:hypothetical protein FNF29_04130 [Cafeteria roenbergensis]KAA0168189.1 hypothetical protein FNF28_02607 [Cafeteria roenbergensis]|eukprot:KAA0152015.1 hypothetical protein FNF29_04130 [Cafeteria roenbergensis]
MRGQAAAFFGASRAFVERVAAVAASRPEPSVAASLLSAGRAGRGTRGGETEEHLMFKAALAEATRSTGGCAVEEFPGNGWRADVMAAWPSAGPGGGEHAWAEAAPGTSDVAGLVEESESDDGEQPKMAEWVQCESCRVWRLLPAHVRPSDLPVTWVCREATWRRLRCSEDMDGPEAMVNSDESRAVSPAGKGLREVSFPPAAAEPKLPVEEQEWVQCENCNKWRRLPPSVKASSLPEHWFCSQGQSWLPGLTCRLPEDESLWKVSAPAGSADGAHAAASSRAVSAGDRPGSSPDPQSPPERSLADAAAAAAIEASAPISFAAGTEAARAAVGTGPSGRGHPGAGSMAARTRSSGGAGGGSAIGTSISGAGAATAHASDSGESVPALPHWAHPLRPMSGYPGAPQPWRSISGLRASQQSHALVAVGLGFAPPTRKADCLESQEPGPSWTDIVFPNGSKPRYGGALAHGRGTAAALSHSCFVSSTAYVPEAVDVAVWGGMQRRLDQQERDAGARGMRTDCLPKGKAFCTAHPFDEQTVCGQQSGAMAAEARRLADELESAAAAMDRIGKQLGAPYCERESLACAESRAKLIPVIAKLTAEAREARVAGVYLQEGEPFGPGVPVPSTVSEAGAAITAAQELSQKAVSDARTLALQRELVATSGGDGDDADLLGDLGDLDV